MKIASITAAFLVSTQVHAADLPLPKDGWASWQVEAVEDAPESCCFSSWKGAPDARTCDLDNDNQSYGSRDDAKTDTVRVYARFANGKVQRLRAFAASCPVKSKTPVQNLEGISTEDSARWIIGLKGGNLDRDAWLSSLAQHRGDAAFNELKSMARSGPATETRKQAIFWLAVLRGTAGAEVVSHLLFNDADANIREHATFAVAQSKSPRIAADLIRAGNTDANGDVREQAWFWLAQEGAPEAEAAITQAAKTDQSEDVREQAIFALSQLPDDRATRALIAAAEDRSLSREQRKRALFWLAQSESAEAQAYLDRVLMGNTGAKASRP